MQTRRRVKTAEATRATADDSVSQSGASDGHTQPGTLAVSLAPDIEPQAIQELVPDLNLNAVSAEDISRLLAFVVASATNLDTAQRAYEDAQAKLERQDVELDQALQDRETASNDLRKDIDELNTTLTHIKQERDQLATSNQSLQTQVSTQNNFQASSSIELDTLKHKVADVEREKRDLIGVVSRLKEDGAQRDEEITSLRTNLKQARQDYQTLEGQLRDVRSTETSTKFKLDSLTQQLELAQTESERATSELTSKSAEFAKYRRERHAELAQLQTSYDALTQTHGATESSLRALQGAHTTQGHQLQQALGRVQDLQGQLAEREATFASEAAGLRRLVALMEDREAEAKQIVENIEREWAAVGERAERREGTLRAEADRERARAEQAEKRVQQLDAILGKLDRGELPIPGGAGSVPATPGTPFRIGTPDGLNQGLFGLSPTVALASKAQKTGKTFTEVYADYARLQDEMARKNAEFEHMELTLTSVLAQIEEYAPTLAQQREEYDRLRAEANETTAQLSQAITDRDQHMSTQTETAQKLNKAKQENDLLQKQLEDLGRQVQTLLRDQVRASDPSLPADIDMDHIAPAENIQEVITNELVLFRSLPALQEQNQKLLRVVRELGNKMEAEEREYREQLEKEQGAAVAEAHEAIEELERRLEQQQRAHDAQLAAYQKERDTLRVMVGRAERVSGSGASVAAAASVNGADAGPVMEAEAQRKLAETENQFEAFKTEMNVDIGRIREEATTASREVTTLTTLLAKANAKIEYLNERHRMAQDQYAVQARELDGLSKRNEQVYHQYTRMDVEYNKALDDLSIATSNLEQLRNECANLRAEKKIWASVQSRLVDENRTLSLERSHLSDLMANVQKLHNDLEQSGLNERHRLEAQIKLMEGQTQDLRVQLEKERDNLRHSTLQKDMDIRELQNKQERLSLDFASTRESLVGAETSKKHLEERVEELNKYLQANQEKLSVYERRPGGSFVGASGTGSSLDQNFEAEVADLRAALKVAEVDLNNARGHVQQFQEISQANEAALESLSTTHDEYKTATEAQIARLESDITALNERYQTLQQENTQGNAKFSTLQHQLETERVAWANDKKTLEDTIVELSTSERMTENDRTTRESEVREQVERAKAAEDRYSREVVAHADSIKAVQELRQQLHVAQEAGRTGTAAAESAQAKLAASETSWKQQREALEKEVSDLNVRVKDLASQNSVLHQHLESVSSAATRINQARDASMSMASISDIDSPDDTETRLAELRSVVAYLRKEKGIVDLQIDLAKQEVIRLKSQIDHLSHNLEDARETLSQERERAVEAAASNTQHAELVERINQLTILRESNATLRADCEAHAKRARELDMKLKQVQAELDPALEQARIAQAERGASALQIERLERESKTWQDRNKQLLSKYDRIDPAEVQALRDEIVQLKAEKEATVEAAGTNNAQVVAKDERIAALENSVRQYKESLARATNGARQHFQKVNAEKAAAISEREQARSELKAAVAERDVLHAQLEGGATTEGLTMLTQQVETLTQEKVNLERSLAEAKAVQTISTPMEQTTQLEQTVVELRLERDALLAEKATWAVSGSTGTDVAPSQPVDELQSQWEAERAELAKAKEDALRQAQAATTTLTNKDTELKGKQAFIERLQKKVADMMRAQNSAAEDKAAAVTAAVEKVKSELGSAATPATDDAASRLAEELQALETRLAEKHQQELEAAIAEAKKATASTPASSDQPDVAASVAAALAAREKELQEEHARALEQATESGRKESEMKYKIKDGQRQRLELRLKTLEAENIELKKKTGGGAPPTPTVAVPATAAGTSAATAAAAANPSLPAKPGAAKPPAARQSVGGPAATAGLARKPSLGGAAPPAGAAAAGGAVPTAAAPAPAPQAGTPGGGRGGRGGRMARGGARGGAQAARGGINVLGAATAAAANGGEASGAGLSISGAAAKRSREESEGGGDDSLAKRLRPADAKPPVQIRRNPPA